MKKDKEWLKQAIKDNGLICSAKLYDLIDQLDEPQKPILPQFIANWIEDVFSDLESLERQVKDRSEGSAKDIKCQLEIMRNNLLWISFGEEIAEKVIKILEEEK